MGGGRKKNYPTAKIFNERGGQEVQVCVCVCVCVARYFQKLHLKNPKGGKRERARESKIITVRKR